MKPITKKDGSYDPNKVAFVIGGSNAGFFMRRDFHDYIEIRYTVGSNFELSLLRIVHHPADFTKEYVEEFIKNGEEHLFASTGMRIKLQLKQ